MNFSANFSKASVQTYHQVSFYQELLKALRHVGLPVFLLFATGSALDQWLTLQMHDILASPNGVNAWIWGYGICSMLASLLFPLTALVWVVRNRVTLNDYSQVVIESLRSWGKIISWSLLFIIPGLIQWLRLSFVPFVVLESPAYQRGELDALDTSAKLSRGQLLKIAGLLLLFSGLFPMGLTTWDEYKAIWKTPFPSLGLSLIDSFLAIVFLLLLKRIFFRSAREADHDILETPETL